jgi:phosphate transport system substrate-binding protein
MHVRFKALALAAVGLACLPTLASARSQIRIVGSSTVYPFATAVSERLTRGNPNMQPPVIESTGTGGGFKLFCSGVGERFPDISNASRRIKASEVKLCATNGVSQITEIQIGMDGLAIATAKSTGLSGMTLADFYAGVAKNPWGKPNRAKTWKDVNPKLPALKIQVYGPPPTSGTRDSFNELLMTAGCETKPAMKALAKTDSAKHKSVCTELREDGGFIEAGENDNLIVQKLEANPGTLGAFGYSYLEENLAQLKGLSLNGVEPTYETISTFKYPGARAMFIYVKNAHVRAIPAIKAYVAEFSKETAWGKNGYLAKRGLIASPDPVRAKAAAAAKAFTPLDPKTIK